MILKNGLNLDQKLMLWKQYDDHINQIDAALVNVTALVSVVFAVAAGFNIGGNILLYSMPIAIVIFLYYIAYQQRVTEILRGYLCYIEEEIMNETQCPEISWSTYGVMVHYNVKNFRAQKLCGALFGCYLLPMVVYVFYKIYLDEQVLTVVWAVYLFTFMFFSVAFLLDILGNPRVHKDVMSGLKNITSQKHNISK